MKVKIKTVKKPWGKEEWIAHSEKYVGKIIHINPGKRLSRQYHRIKHETVYVAEGELILELENEKILLNKGESFEIPQKTIHRFGADKKKVRIFEVSTPEVDDVVRLEDDYGRTDGKN